MGQRRRSAPSPQTQGGKRGHPNGQQFQPPTTSGAGSQMGGGEYLFEQPGGSNEFMQELMGQKTDFA